MVAGPLYEIAAKVVVLIKPTSEPATLYDHLDSKMDEIRELCKGRFNLWQGVLNVIQQWFITGHQAFADIRHLIVVGEPWEGERDDAVQDCMESDDWRDWRPKTQLSADDPLPEHHCHC